MEITFTTLLTTCLAFQLHQHHLVQVHSSFLDQSTELDIAIHLTSDALEQHQRAIAIGSTALVCETWVFAWLIRPNSETNTRLSDEFSEAHSKANQRNQNQRPSPKVLLTFDGSEARHTNFSYDTEWSEADILAPTRLGFRRHTPNYVSSFITVQAGDADAGSSITESLLLTKTARPHKDYFIYMGSERPVRQLLSAERLKDVRFKFGIVSQSGNEKRLWWNTCERSGESLELFSRKCDALISNRHFLITACNIPTLVSYEHHPDGSLKWGSGTIYSMFVETARRNNLTFDIRYAHFNGASGFKKDGKWYGAVGEVFSREADIAFAVAPTVYRHVINDPGVTQIYMIRVFFILRPPYKTSWQSIYWPLTKNVWLLTISTTLLLVTPVFYFSAVAYMKSLRDTSHANLLGEVIDALYRILMEQAATWRHWTGSRIRILVLIWTFFCLVLRTSYSSKLIVFLSFLQQAPLPETHRELSLSSYKMYFRYYGGVAYHYTSISTDPMHKRILRKSMLVNTSDECMAIALNDPHAACLDYKMSAEYAVSKTLVLSSHENTEFFIGSKDTDVKIHIVWSYRKGSPWIESFDKSVLNILAAGLYEVWKARDWYEAKKDGSAWVKKNPGIRQKLLKVKEGLGTGPKPLDVDSLFGVFMIMVVGFVVAGLSCGLEWLSFVMKGRLRGRKVDPERSGLDLEKVYELK